jgi:glycosyltransferase involved in cell wall biosynthesis
MVSEAGLTVLPNGVDVEAWQPDHAVRTALRRKHELEDKFLWFAAGRLEPVKDYTTLLWAFAQTPDAAHLAIAGSGSLQAELCQLAATLGLSHRVHFLGFEPDVRRWMQAADGFVLSSRWEGLPMGLLEAAACALPAVATDVLGTREAIVHGETGWLVPVESAMTLGARMIGLMQMPPEDRKAMGGRARQQVIERYSLEVVLDRWEVLFADLLSRNPKPRRWGRRK